VTAAKNEALAPGPEHPAPILGRRNSVPIDINPSYGNYVFTSTPGLTAVVAAMATRPPPDAPTAAGWCIVLFEVDLLVGELVEHLLHQGRPATIAAEVTSADETVEIVASGAAVHLVAEGNAATTLDQASPRFPWRILDWPSSPLPGGAATAASSCRASSTSASRRLDEQPTTLPGRVVTLWSSVADLRTAERATGPARRGQE
jgi:hypothetical protein